MVEIVALSSRSLVVPFKGIILVMLPYMITVTLLSTLIHISEFLPLVRSFLGKLTQRLRLLSDRGMKIHGWVKVCVKPAKVVLILLFLPTLEKLQPFLGKFLKREKAASCSLKM